MTLPPAQDTPSPKPHHSKGLTPGHFREFPVSSFHRLRPPHARHLVTRLRAARQRGTPHVPQAAYLRTVTMTGERPLLSS